jgi:hypothetical protein
MDSALVLTLLPQLSLLIATLILGCVYAAWS